MGRTIEIQPGDILTGAVMRFHLDYKTKSDSDSQQYNMTADVDCENISIEDVKDLMAGQGLVVKSQNNRERKMTNLAGKTHFKGDWRTFTKSSGRGKIDIASIDPEATFNMMTAEQKAFVVRAMREDEEKQALMKRANEYIDKGVEANEAVALAQADIDEETLTNDAG